MLTKPRDISAPATSAYRRGRALYLVLGTACAGWHVANMAVDLATGRHLALVLGYILPSIYVACVVALGFGFDALRGLTMLLALLSGLRFLLIGGAVIGTLLVQAGSAPEAWRLAEVIVLSLIVPGVFGLLDLALFALLASRSSVNSFVRLQGNRRRATADDA